MEIVISKPKDLKYLGENAYTEIVDLVEKEIVDTQLLVSTTKEISDMQIAMAARLIISDYSDLTFQDIQRCFKDGIKGLYGEIFRFDVNTVCSWLTKHQQAKKDLIKTLPPPLTQDQLKNLKKWQETKVTDPAKTEDIVKAKGMPDNVREGFVKMFQKHGIKNPFEKDSKKEKEYKWPTPKDDFEKDCLEVFTEKWKEQKETVLRSNNRPYMIFEDIMFNPDNWLTYCYQLKLKSEIK